MTPETYTRDSDGKKFKITNVDGMQFRGELLYTVEYMLSSPIPEPEPMPELELGDLIGIKGTHGYYHYICAISVNEAIQNEFGNIQDASKRDVHYRNGSKLWEAKK